MEENKEKAEKSIDERVHQQLVYKDNRIIDLNNVILDKERQILDLQERVREHNEVNTVKNQAMRIVQQKFEEMHRDKKDMSTETDQNLLSGGHGPSTSSSSTPSTSASRRTRSSSPGHVIAARTSESVANTSSGTFSPPPIDPLFETSTSTSSKLGANLPDVDGILRKQHHQRKRVTFDLHPNSPRIHVNQPSNPDALESALTEASSENALLRQQVVDLNAAVEKMKSDYESEIVKYTKEAKTAGLKAKVAATARIKELESTLEEINGKYQNENECLKEEVATLRSSRNWEIEQNGQFREKIAHLKEKAHKLTEELDESEKAKRSLDTEVEESKKLMELMVDDLLQAENAINYHVNQKEAIFQDVDRLKDAIVAQDRFIEILEADIVIYEQHIGLLRESLGASKIDHRALIKSKAFETKLHALEREKEQSDKKSNEDRLKTKALDKKCRVLVEQNEQLMARLCELEMSSSTSGDEKDRRLAEQDERIRQVTAALESERDVGLRLREAKEVLERELLAKSRNEEVSSQRMRRDVEMTQMDAEKKIAEMTVEVDAAQKKVADVMAEVEQLRATNFDLQMHIETAKRTMGELADSNEEMEERIQQLEESFEAKEEEQRQSTFDVEMLNKQNVAYNSRLELDSIRQGFTDTAELKKEVKSLKAELNRQDEYHRAHFDRACEQLVEDEQQGDVAQRKTSLEVQQEQYILAYEEQVEKMNEEIQKHEEEKEQMRRLLEEKEQEIKRLVENAQPVQRKTTAVLEQPNLEEIQKTEVQMTSAPPPPPPQEEEGDVDLDALKKQNSELAERLGRAEMEANLSGELNVELGRAMLELEEQNALLRREQVASTADTSASVRELELHVMLVQDMTEQIASMQARMEEMELATEQEKEQVQRMKMEIAASHHEHQKTKSEMERLLHNLAEFEIARKDDLEKANAEHDAEIRAFSIKMDDARREISDLEAQLQQSTQKLLEVRETSVVFQETQILSSSTPIPEAAESSEVSEDVVAPEGDDELREQNKLLRECHQDVSKDMQKLIELKEELEVAVQALKGEIWTLNGQLKASILDREGLEDKVAELDSLVEKEKKRAISLDVELQEQVDLTDRAVRRAAEAENESNQRMAECLEKETRREEIEKAYTRLNEYYNQLQEAYNNVYAQLAAAQAVSQESTSSDSVQTVIETPLLTSSSSDASDVVTLIDGIMTILLIARESSISLSTQQKLEKVSEKLRNLLAEFDENQKALEEQRRISEALEQRLQTLEIERNSASGSDDVTTTRERVQQLEGEIEWKEEECEGLKRRIRELEKALEAVAERADEGEAARLTTRQADVDSLFRTNAELAHTNVRLQNEVDESEEWKARMEEVKQSLEQNIKELEDQVAELMEQHEEHLQRTQVLQTSAPPAPSAELEEAQSEVQRLIQIEAVLNNRILALEDQNLELEEKVQEIEEELLAVKNQEAPAQTEKSGGWDDWGESSAPQTNSELEEAKNEVQRLQEVEKALKIRMEVLELQNVQLTEQKSAQNQQKDDDWGWGEEKPEEEAPKQDDNDWGWDEPTKKPTTSSENSELLEAKSEIQRLAQIEKVLNNRILALEDQNLELEENLQQLEEELITVKKEAEAQAQKASEVEIPKATDDWDDWGEGESTTPSAPAAPAPTNEEHAAEIQALEQTIAELRNQFVFQKEIIQKAETELSEQMDKYDQILEQYDESEEEVRKLEAQLEALSAELTLARAERDSLIQKLQDREAEMKKLEAALQVKEAEKQEEDNGWNDDGWGDDDKKEQNNSEKVAQLQVVQQELTKRIHELEGEKINVQADHDETIEKLAVTEQAKQRLEKELASNRKQLQELLQKVNELTEAAATSSANEWNDSEWADDSELEKLKENQKVLEMRVEALLEELNKVREDRQEIINTNADLLDRLAATELELASTKQKLEETESAGWNDNWNNDESEEIKKALEAELQKRNDTVEKLYEQISQLQRELIEASESADLSALEELERVRQELHAVSEQNGLLKDSEARLLDHADEFAVQMEQYKEKCSVLTGRVKELEEQLKKQGQDEQAGKKNSEEIIKLRQLLANSEQEVRNRNATISDREGLIAELRRQVSEQTKTIEELQLKLKTLSVARRVARPSTSSTTSHAHAHQQMTSRPSSRLSTSSRHSTSSSFVPEAISVPLQSAGSAFDVVLPQSGEPLRRRNK